MTIEPADILLVEDSPEDRELTMRALTKRRLANNIVAVEDGAEALDFLFARGKYANRANMDLPRLVLLDLKLPKVDGIEVLRQIRGDPKLHTMPVVVLTSSSEQRDIVNTYDLGVNSFITKPVEFEDFRPRRRGNRHVLDDPQPTPGRLWYRDVTRSATAARASPAQDGELRVLILEDVSADAELIARALKTAGINASVKVVDTKRSFAEELTESSPDLVLADYSLPGFDGEQALEISRTIAPEVPFIFVTGTLGEEHAVELMKQGAWDYVTKEHLSRLELAVRRALKEVVASRDREELRQREQAATTALRESEERFRALVQNSADIIIIVDEDGIITYGSPAAKTVLGIDPVDALGSNVFDLVHPDDRDRTVATFREALQLPGPHAPLNFRARRADGIYVDLEAVSNNLLDDPAVRAVVINARDVTERQRAERLLKSEARILDDIASGARLEHSLKEIAREMEGHVSDWPCLIILSGEPIPIFTVGDRLPAKAQLDMSRLAVGAAGCPWLESGIG